MEVFIIKRLLTMVPLWLLLSIITFFLIELPPGDIVTNEVIALRAQNIEVDEAAIARMRAQWQLDAPFLSRYLRWLGNIALRGDLGSTVDGRENLDVLRETIPYTLVIGVSAFVLSLGVAIPMGIYSATHQYSTVDYVTTFLAFIGLGAPGWLLAIVLAWASLYFFDFVPLGINSLEYLDAPWSHEKAIDTAKHLWAPILLTALPSIGGIIRVVRNNLLDQLGQQYVVTARAKGLPERRLVRKYPVRIALNPLVSDLGQMVYGIVAGQGLIGIVLGLPTLGPLLLNSLVAQDMILAGTILLIYASIIWLSTLLSDVVLAWFDPRIRFEARS
ncbi:MAG: ABC transporter permease [Anaerolineaceae bacterium]|nr:ABC transporter permease [Anaerolineaceae bacterium]MCY3907190.1 ABC transporter permease [Anaerolineaceae bacterium]